MHYHIHVQSLIVRIFTVSLCAFLLVGQPAYAGKLDDFEEEATEEENHDQWQYHDDDDDDDESLFGAFFRGFFRILFLDPDDDDDDVSRSTGPSYVRSESRHPSLQTFPRYNPVVLPSLRVDGSYQNVLSDVGAFDLRAEGGYDFLAVQGRFTYYTEEEPDDELWLNYIHGVLRLSVGEHLALGPGAGVTILSGNNRNSGFSWTLPILFYPRKSVGIEFRPVWSWINENPIDDYDVSLVLGSKHAAFRAGYRWVNADSESLDGPYMGVTVRF